MKQENKYRGRCTKCKYFKVIRHHFKNVNWCEWHLRGINKVQDKRSCFKI